MKGRFVSLWKTALFLAILSSPQTPGKGKHPFSSIQVATRMMAAVDATTEEDIIRISIHRPGPSLKEWRLNTNFDNVANWQGLAGHENCTKNIYEFPAWYEQEFVVTLPSVFIGKQIILPVNGHFVFREGVTTFSPPPQELLQEATCRGREVKFLRASRADWLDPDNWIHRGVVKISQNGNSLLNDKDDGSINNNNNIPSSQFEAIPHVERVPCQYDSVRFPANSSFNLKISSNVTISNFFLGNKKQSYTDVAILMNSPLGKLQFQKKPETIFSITSSKQTGGGAAAETNGNDAAAVSPTPTPPVSPSAVCTGKDEEITDSDHCICANYVDQKLKQKICSLADCTGGDVEDACPNPITPHGFCCPICGFHMRIRHSGNLRLVPLHSKLKGEISRANLEGKVLVHLSRYKERSAHLVVVAASPIPHNSQHEDNSLLVRIGRLVVRIQSILNREESEVIGVTLTESWGELLPSGESTGTGASSDRLEGSGLGGGLITLIVLLSLVALLAGIALFIFIWNKKHGYPPLTLSSVTSAFPRMPSMSMRIPIVSGVGGGGRRSSTLSNSLHSFGFARFTNERVSSVTIGRSDPDSQSEAADGATSGGEGGKSVGKSSSIRRAEQVDDEPLPNEEKVSDANSGAFGFSNVTYDLVAGMGGSSVDGEGEEEKRKVPAPTPLLTIPEVTVIDMDDQPYGGSTSGDLTAPPDSSSTITTSLSSLSASSTGTNPTNNGNKEEGSKSGKFSKPSFIASRMASAYKKLAPEELEDHEDEKDKEKKESGISTGETLKKKGKKKGKDVGGADSDINRQKEEEPAKSSPTTTTTASTTDHDQQSHEAEQRQEEQEIFQEFISVAEDTVAAAAAASPVHVEEAKIIDFE